MKKIVIDTSALITALLSFKRSYIHDVLDSIVDGETSSFISEESTNEIFEVFNRQRIQKTLANRSVKARLFLEKYIAHCIVVNPVGKINLCRDPKDDIFLEIAESVSADYIITVDEDLLVLDSYRSTDIVRPYEYIQLEKYNYKRHDFA